MKKLVLSILAVYCFLNIKAQDIHFSQFTLTPMLVNPAQAGATRNIQGTINYKNQWASISPDAFKTMMVTVDGRLMQQKWKSKWMGVGLSVASDKAGEAAMKSTLINSSIGYHTQLDEKNILGASLSAGFTQRSVDVTKLTWDEQYVNGSYVSSAASNEQIASNKYSFADFGFGILHQFRKGQVQSKDNDMVIIQTGLSVSHLNKPSYSFKDDGEKLYARITGHIDGIIGIKNSNFGFMPGFLFMKQGPAVEILPGNYIRYRISDSDEIPGEYRSTSIAIGTHLRVKDAFIPSVLFETGNFTIGISYDMNVSGLKSATSGNGGFELSIRYGRSITAARTAASFQ